MKLNKSLRAVEHGEGYFQINAVAVAFRGQMGVVHDTVTTVS